MNSIFKQLTRGVNFNTNLYRTEAEKFGLVKPCDDLKSAAPLSLPTISEVKKEVEEKKKREESNQSDSEEEIKLIGNITSTKKTKKKKKKEKKESEKIKELYTERVNGFRNANKIHVHGADIPTPVSEWVQLVDDYGVSETMFNNITYPKPSPVQMQTIPLMLKSREVLSCAPTGSGKTAAYLIPILHALKAPRNGGYRAVIVVPTKELAVQIERECLKLCEGTGIRPHCQGKVKEKTQPMKPKFDILITPPNRLVYMINHDPPLLNLDKVEWLIIDEADKLFEAGVTGFREQLATIYKACSGPNIRRGMFSATLGEDVQSWCKLNLDNPASVRVGASHSATETIEQKLLYCGNEHGKLVAFRSLVQKGIQPPVLVFVQTKERAQELFRELLYDGLHVDVIHSDRSQLQRENTVRAFRSGGIWILICTELMGRGIDFKGVNLVINYDFPPSAVSYIHRIGRTGRAGRTGQAVTYFTEEDKPMLKSIAQVMKNSGCEVPEYMLKLKTSKDIKKKLQNKAVKRPVITKAVKKERYEKRKKKEMIEASKKRKMMEDGETQGQLNGEPVIKKARVESDDSKSVTSRKPKLPEKSFKKKKNQKVKEISDSKKSKNVKKKEGHVNKKKKKKLD